MCNIIWIINFFKSAKKLRHKKKEKSWKEFVRLVKGRGFCEWKDVVGQGYINPNIKNLSGPSSRYIS